jgi:hypothetical protein
MVDSHMFDTEALQFARPRTSARSSGVARASMP